MIENDTISLCIPRIETSLTKKQLQKLLFSTFEKLNFGKLKQIDICYNIKNKTYRIYIHFKYWYVCEDVKKYKNYLMEHKENYIKLMYDFPYFWKCFKCCTKD